MTQNRPYIIGLTGGIASGKSTLSRALLDMGAHVIDADKISHELTIVDGVALPAIREAFGDRVFTEEALDRRALGDMVFADAAALDRLNGIMRPLIQAEMLRQIDSLSDQPALILDVPLLYEAGLDKLCDEVWCAWVPRWQQLRRLMRRDGLSLRQALQRVNSQMPGREKARRANHVINTSGTKAQSAAIARKLWLSALRRNPRD
jgi:dephospho-CoA kinase